jgi:hypothetical protein
MFDMSNDRGSRSSLLIWGLALVFIFGIDAAITRTSVLWGPTAFENSGGPRTVFPQTFQVARKIYAPEREAEVRVALLGSSRIVLSAREEGVERALVERDPGLDVKVSNLGIFGSFIGDTAMLARHLDALDPSVVVLTLGGPDLLRKTVNLRAEGPMRVLRIGWSDGPLPARSFGERTDRWVRTLWPLYRFREFAREAVLDRVLRRPDPGPPPRDFDSRLAAFEHLYGDRAARVEAAYRVFLADRSLDSFTSYVEVASPEHLKRGRARAKKTLPLDRETPSVEVLDALLAELAASWRPVAVLLMPENPLLDLDVKGEFHRPEISQQAARLVREIADRHGVSVMDGRRWLPVDCFLDFDHPLFKLEEFEWRLAAEILDVLES